MRRALLVVLAACAGTPVVAPAPAPPPAPPPGFVRATELELGEFAVTPRQVVVVDGGHRALLAVGDTLTFVDLDQPALLGPPLELSSESVPSGLPRPYARTRQRSVGLALWAWDERRAALIGAVRLFSSNPDAAGIAAWEPAGRGAPRMLDAGDMTDMLALSPDGTTLLTRVGRDRARRRTEERADEVQVFDLRAGRRAGLPIRTGKVDSAVFSPDGSKIALGLADGALVLLTPSTGLSTVLALGQGPFRFAAFHPTLPLLLVSDGGRTHLWHFGDRQPTSTELAVGPAFAFSPDGRFIAVSQPDRVELYDVTTMMSVGEPHVPSRSRGRVLQLGFSADGRRLVALWDSRALSVIDVGHVEPAAGPPWSSRIRHLALPDPEQPPPFTRDGEVTGRVLLGGAPFAGAVVQLRPSAHEFPDAQALPVQETRTGVDGHYVFPAVARIDWSIIVTAPGHVSRKQVGFTNLARLRDARTAVVDMPIARVMKLTGKVVGPPGKVAGTQVQVVPTTFGLDATTVTVGRDGRFVVDNLASGTPHAVWADGPGDAAGFAEVTGRRPLEKVTVKLHRHGTAGVIRVRAVSPSGVPLPDVWVSLFSPNHDATTGADGTYTFAMPPKATRLSIIAGIPTNLRAFERTYEPPFPTDIEMVIAESWR